MKTIKIIDLLYKIAKGEEVPKMIKHNNAIYSDIYLDHYKYTDYEDVKSGDLLFADRLIIQEQLNDEVEIIEEDKFEDIDALPMDELYLTEGQQSSIVNTINYLIKNQKKIIKELKNK